MRLLILLPLFLLIAGCDRQESASRQAEPAAAAAPKALAAGLDRSQAGKAAPDVIFKNENGEEITLAELAGKPVLLNLWATWCAPCVKELPTLEALSKREGAPQVVALSQDMQPPATVSRFLDRRRIGLEAFQDSDMAMSSALGVNILPTTILYGADSKEIWRYSGDLDWTGPEAAKLISEGL
jgi:thiol-disulfide isomerase/thioredoxin